VSVEDLVGREEGRGYPVEDASPGEGAAGLNSVIDPGYSPGPRDSPHPDASHPKESGELRRSVR
jgi:hypothetical protein